MLVINFIISNGKIRSYLFILFSSFSFCQYFIVPQRPVLDLLKWEEINTNSILINKIGPMFSADLNSSEIPSFYYSDYKSNGIIKYDISSEFSINSIKSNRVRLYGTAGITLSERLTIQNEFEFDNHGEDDPNFHRYGDGERDSAKGWVGYLQHSSLTYN